MRLVSEVQGSYRPIHSSQIYLLTSSNRAVKVEDLHIASPETDRHNKVLASLDSAFIKQEDKNLPRLRGASKSTKPDKLVARYELQKSRLDRRKLTFSSDDEDDEGAISTISAQIDYHEEPATPSYPDYEVDNGAYEENDTNEKDTNEKDTSEKDTNDKEYSGAKKEESMEPPAKRRRGRPRKSEQEKKELVVTRRSRRIVENPTLRKHHSLEQPTLMLVPKPLRVTGLVPGSGVVLTESSRSTILLTQKPSGKQKPLTIDAERLHTASSRDKRFNLTTLDVLRQFVDEYAPRATKNDIINEQIVMDEFKAHLLYHVRHLTDLHASIRDISHDIIEVQRRKNEVRKNILELKRKHGEIGIELTKVRKEYTDDKRNHGEFQSMVSAFNQLKAAVTSQWLTTSLSDKVQMDLDDLGRIFDPRQGLAVQLRAINTELAARLEN